VDANDSPRGWEADTSANFVRRLGKAASEMPLDPKDPSKGFQTNGPNGCPDIQLLSSGEIFLVTRLAPADMLSRRPCDVKIRRDEAGGIISGPMFEAAARDYIAWIDVERAKEQLDPTDKEAEG
jgi:hypothetical protein